MYIWYENYKGGINNLIVVEKNGIRATSTISKEKAIQSLERKLKNI